SLHLTTTNHPHQQQLNLPETPTLPLPLTLLTLNSPGLAPSDRNLQPVWMGKLTESPWTKPSNSTAQHSTSSTWAPTPSPTSKNKPAPPTAPNTPQNGSRPSASKRNTAICVYRSWHNTNPTPKSATSKSAAYGGRPSNTEHQMNDRYAVVSAIITAPVGRMDHTSSLLARDGSDKCSLIQGHIDLSAAGLPASVHSCAEDDHTVKEARIEQGCRGCRGDDPPASRTG